jgi:hypothetical protein
MLFFTSMTIYFKYATELRVLLLLIIITITLHKHNLYFGITDLDLLNTKRYNESLAECGKAVSIDPSNTM